MDISNKKEKRKNKGKRLYIQFLSAILFNPNFKGFYEGKIYTGKLKSVCVPVLNCYSCPGALGACPIGSMQAVIGGFRHQVSFYVTGLLMLFGVLMGRLICGFLCPFGLVQDLLYKIKTKKAALPKKLTNVLKYLKYVILAVFVIILPTIMQDDVGMSDPYFCKYICPQGVLGGAFPLLYKNPDLRQMLGTLFAWKVGILIFIVISSIFIYRIFCRFLCPLGAIYGLFNKFSFYRFKIDNSCIHCKKCQKVCKFNIPTYEKPNSPECIRCNDCVRECPVHAIKIEQPFSKTKEDNTLINIKE